MKLRRFIVALAGVAAGVLATVAMPAGPADAHAALIRTQPAQGSVVQQAPSEIVITFSEQVTPVPEKIMVIAPDGTRIDRGRPTVDGDDMHIPVRTDVPRGTYVVAYRVISADSHPVGAGFSYSVGAPSPPAQIPTGSDAGSTNPVVATAVSVAHYLGYAGLILVAGGTLILAGLWPRRLPRQGPTRLALGGLGLVALATLLEIYLQAPYSIGSGLFSITGHDLVDVLDSAYGEAHLARLVLLVAVGLLLPPVLAGRSGPARRWTVAALAVVAAATWGYGSHPGHSSVPVLTVIADTAHVAGMAVWVGGLVMLLGYLLRRATARELGAILPVWSTWATAAVSVLVLAGVTQALVEIGSVNALIHTSYGQLVLLKVGLLVLVMAAAAVSRQVALGRAGTAVAGPPAQAVDEDGMVDEDDEADVAAQRPVPALVGAGSGGVVEESGSDRSDDDFPDDDFPDDEGPDDEGPDDDSLEDGFPEDERAEDGSVPRTPDVAAGPGVRALRRLRRSVLVETIGAILIIGAASVLVQTTPATTVSADGSGGTHSGMFSTTLTSPLYQLQIDIEPGRTGPNDIHMYAYSPVGAPMKVLEWHASASLPSAGIDSIEAVLTSVTDSHEIGQITLPSPGNWQFSFTLRTSEIDEATVTTMVKIT